MLTKIMLPRSNRLKRRKDFEKVFKKGKTLRKKFLVFKFVENNLEQSRFGFIVSQKISKKAVLRNKIKRQITEAVREKIKDLKKGLDGIFIALPGIEKQNFFETKKTVENLLKKTVL